MKHVIAAAIFLFGLSLSAPVLAQPVSPPVFETDVIPHADIAAGQVSLFDIRKRGMQVFSTPFSREIGYGDGPINPQDTTSPGGRPTLQGSGMHLRTNGLDAQTCMECHAVLSHLTVPFTFGVGGVAGNNANAIFQPTYIDVADSQGLGKADMNGRFINPPFLFGSGGIELLGKEITRRLQAQKRRARANPGTPVELIAKGVSYGQIVYQNGAFDTSGVEGVDEDLVVRPFGRKGEFETVRAFDVGAMRFHFGMEPVEDVGHGDPDGDGVSDEISVGDLSTLSIFNTNLERPRIAGGDADSAEGFQTFKLIGCADCHVPFMDTIRPRLTYSFPEEPTRPFRNRYYRADLRDAAGFEPSPRTGGVRVRHFSDLKRHDMGPELAESFGSPLDSQFITARLWGVADTQPYLHDGRAHTLKEAILLHGGEAEDVRNTFAGLGPGAQEKVIRFLLTLRTPEKPADDLLN